MPTAEATHSNESLHALGVSRDYSLADALDPEYLDTAEAEPTLRDRAMKLRVRHVMLSWYSVTDGIGAWVVKAYWHGGDVVAHGGYDAACLAVQMFERARVAEAQGF